MMNMPMMQALRRNAGRAARLLALGALAACQGGTPSGPESLTGKWNAQVLVGTQQEVLPFRFEILEESGKPVAYLINAEERIRVEDIRLSGDSVYMGMHIFNTELRAKQTEQGLQGQWVKLDYDDYAIPFSAQRTEAFSLPQGQGEAIAGKWEVAFEEEGGDSPAVGMFSQDGATLTGTFLTPTGDYRYLFGHINGSRFELSCFDGEHAFLFRGEVLGDSISGRFWSGKNWEQAWIAKRNEQATLPDANALTYLKEGYDRFSFTFPDLDGKPVSLSDERFRDKVVVVQLMGSWCPNCMDETAFLADFYQKNKDKGLEIVALAFERQPTLEAAKPRLEKLAKRFGIGYTLLLAGSNSKDDASAKLPMLNHVMSFPTTIILDRKGEVRRIHTGFSGPGTGEYYSRFVEEFSAFVGQLLTE